MNDDFFRGNERQHAGLILDSMPASRLKYSFQTTAEGHIPLTRDWDLLLNRMRRLPHFFVQVDNPHARMSMRLEQPDLKNSLDGQVTHNGLLIDPSYPGWSSAHARIEKCTCCGAPGGLSLLNPQGLPFMQLNPPSDATPIDWARLLCGIAANISSTTEAATSTASPMQVPDQAMDLNLRGVGCLKLFRDLAENGLPMEFTLCATEVQLRQSYIIQCLQESNGILECIGKSAGFNLYLPAVETSFAVIEAGRLTLMLIDITGRVLLTIRSKQNANTEAEFQQLLGI